MKIAIAGGTGFVGKALIHELLKQDHDIVILTRKATHTNENRKIRYVQWLSENTDPSRALQGTDIIINLAGESINSGRWTEQRKSRIINSRVEAVQELLTIISKMETKPSAFINASAIGIYGTSLDKVFTEDSEALGNDFLAETVKRWENEAGKASTFGIRTVFCRFGIILDKDEGALPKITFPYKAFIGGNIGNGRQWMSWIHIDDVVKGISYIIDTESIAGPVNFTAPQPVSMSDLGKTLANVIHRPHWLPVPRFALQLLLGEMSTLVVDGQKVLPHKLLEHNYQFKYPNIKTALVNIFS